MYPSPGAFRHLLDRHLSALKACRLCPHQCGVDRLAGQTGKCGSDAGFNIGSICLHRGEEPVIGGEIGICNIFFSRCNLSCSFCQNWQISRNRGVVKENRMTLEDIVGEVISFLDRGCKSVGFVSPSHVIPQVKMIIEGIRESGYNPVFVYNSNGYDRVEELQGLEAYIDVYLPDFKYADPVLSKEYSGVEDYPVRAIAALKEMYRQKGSTLILDEFGQVEKGMVIRHLVLPGSISNSFQVLEIIAEKLSTSMAISLMSQYYPTPDVRKHEKLGRTLYPEEYERVVEKMDELGFYKGWMQEPGSKDHYRPDFEQLHPFE